VGGSNGRNELHSRRKKRMRHLGFAMLLADASGFEASGSPGLGARQPVGCAAWMQGRVLASGVGRLAWSGSRGCASGARRAGRLGSGQAAR
jgi:hypothetical protein